VKQKMWEFEITATAGITIFIMIVLNWVTTRRARFNILSVCGIPGPEPSFWSGNMKDCFTIPNLEYENHLIKT